MSLKRLGLIFFFLLMVSNVYAQTEEITISGIIKDTNGNPINGTFTLTFNFYTSKTSESPIFGVTLPQVLVKNGVFHELIDTSPKEIFKNNEELWIGVTLEDNPEFPRFKLTSTGYAIRAKYAEKLLMPPQEIACTGCIGTKELADSSVTGIKIEDGSIEDKDISSLSWSKLTDVPEGFADNVDNVGVDGKGDAGYLPVFSDTQKVENSVIFQNNKQIGVAKLDPQVMLDVNGEIRPGFTGIPCSNKIVGAIRYNVKKKILEFCDGEGWKPVNQDNYPNGLFFNNVTKAELGVLVFSNIVQVNGISVPVEVSVSGNNDPAYRICKNSDCSTVITDWTNEIGEVNEGEYLQLRVTSSTNSETTVNVNVSVGTKTTVWSVTTKDAEPDIFTFKTVEGDVTAPVESNIVQISGIDNWINVNVDGKGGPEFRVCNDNACMNVAADWASSGTIDNGQYLQLRGLNDSANEYTIQVQAGTYTTLWKITPDQTPDKFDFVNKTGNPGEIVTSDILEIKNFAGKILVSISGEGNPEYRICNNSDCTSVFKDWTSEDGFITSGKFLQLRLKASGVEGTTTTATVYVGSRSDSWGVMNVLYKFTKHTFTNCGQTGRTGPTLTQCRNAYQTDWDENDEFFNMNVQGIQIWTVPQTGTYRITAAGAAGWGANSSGGYGAIIAGDFKLNQGQKLQILVGQRGTSKYNNYGGGGGGTYVATLNNTPLIVAGGGGGSDNRYNNCASMHASSSTSGNSSCTCSSNYSGGTNGNGGSGGGGSGGGGGFYTDGGGSPYEGKAFVHGGVGGSGSQGDGGFGGGGGTTDDQGAAGGGYSGGGACGENGNAGGGGSYNSGTNQKNQAGANSGHGYVTIELLN